MGLLIFGGKFWWILFMVLWILLVVWLLFIFKLKLIIVVDSLLVMVDFSCLIFFKFVIVFLIFFVICVFNFVGFVFCWVIVIDIRGILILGKLFIFNWKNDISFIIVKIKNMIKVGIGFLID